MEVVVHDCDCDHSARAGGDLGPGRGQGEHSSGYVPAGCMQDADMVSALFIAAEH